ncbi:MAG: hypothetical protein ACI4FZ_07560 [Lachnospiraceae bacterium]
MDDMEKKFCDNLYRVFETDSDRKRRRNLKNFKLSFVAFLWSTLLVFGVRVAEGVPIELIIMVSIISGISVILMVIFLLFYCFDYK